MSSKLAGARMANGPEPFCGGRRIRVPATTQSGFNQHKIGFGTGGYVRGKPRNLRKATRQILGDPLVRLFGGRLRTVIIAGCVRAHSPDMNGPEGRVMFASGVQ